MILEEFRNFCLSLPAVSECLPFDENILAFKVLDKIFALTSLDSLTLKVNLKCNPEKAVELREKYEEIIPGFHMNKKHWNTIDFSGKLPVELLKKLTTDSYYLVIQGMTKAKQNEIISLTKELKR